MKKEEQKLKDAKKRVRDLKEFYIHLFFFTFVNIIIFLVNYVTSGKEGVWWFHWALIGWGIGLFMHFMVTFVVGNLFSDEWEENKIKKIMDKK